MTAVLFCSPERATVPSHKFAMLEALPWGDCYSVSFPLVLF